MREYDKGVQSDSSKDIIKENTLAREMNMTYGQYSAYLMTQNITHCRRSSTLPQPPVEACGK